MQAAITVASKTLPQAMTTPPSYKKVNPADSPILLLSVRSDTMPLTTVDDYADLFLAQQISQVPGVAQVSIFGDRTPSIRIQVDPAKLAASGAHAGRDSQHPRHLHHQRRQGHDQHRQDQLHDRRQRPDHRGRASSTTSSWPIATARRSGCATSARRCAEQVDRTVAAYQNNKPGIILAVFKQPGANVIETVDQIKAQLPQLTARIPPAIEVETILDRTDDHPRLGARTWSSRSGSPSPWW